MHDCNSIQHLWSNVMHFLNLYNSRGLIWCCQRRDDDGDTKKNCKKYFDGDKLIKAFHFISKVLFSCWRVHPAIFFFSHLIELPANGVVNNQVEIGAFMKVFLRKYEKEIDSLCVPAMYLFNSIWNAVLTNVGYMEPTGTLFTVNIYETPSFC